MVCVWCVCVSVCVVVVVVVVGRGGREERGGERRGRGRDGRTDGRRGREGEGGTALSPGFHRSCPLAFTHRSMSTGLSHVSESQQQTKESVQQFDGNDAGSGGGFSALFTAIGVCACYGAYLHLIQWPNAWDDSRRRRHVPSMSSSGFGRSVRTLDVDDHHLCHAVKPQPQEITMFAPTSAGQ